MGKTVRPPKVRKTRDTIPASSYEAAQTGIAPVFTAGEIVAGNYEVRALLGTGAMGQVYEAHDRQLNRRVALKVASSPRNDAHREALAREGQALAAIRHSGVVSVFTMGTHHQPSTTPAQGGERAVDVTFLVMERVYGVTLEAMIEQRRRRGERFDLVEGLEVLIHIADALAAVHRAGLAHRDVKPANVMLAPAGRVVLTDFGLMLPQFESPVPGSEILGTSEYMAPEALSARMTPGDGHLLDLYALGATVFQLFTGILPYMEARKPVPLLRHRGEVSPALDQLVRALLARDPEDRPHSAEAVMWQLRTIRDRLVRSMAAGSAPRPVSDAAPRAEPIHEPFTVLIADDDDDACELLSLYVKAADESADVAIASTGGASLQSLRKRLPTLLLIDLVLPDIPGVEVCMYLRNLPGGDRCVIATTSTKVSHADVYLLGQLGVRFLERGPNLMIGIAKLLEEINGASHT